MDTSLFSVLFLIVGGVVGWLASERYTEWLNKKTHDFEDLFEENPHPEIYDKDGKINRGEYMCVNFDFGYDPEDFDPEDITSEG